jgi:hypothetical protein
MSSIFEDIFLNELDMTTLIGGRSEIIEELGRGYCEITFLAHDRHLPSIQVRLRKFLELIVIHSFWAY